MESFPLATSSEYEEEEEEGGVDNSLSSALIRVNPMVSSSKHSVRKEERARVVCGSEDERRAQRDEATALGIIEEVRGRRGREEEEMPCVSKTIDAALALLTDTRTLKRDLTAERT